MHKFAFLLLVFVVVVAQAHRSMKTINDNGPARIRMVVIGPPARRLSFRKSTNRRSKHAQPEPHNVSGNSEESLAAALSGTREAS